MGRIIPYIMENKKCSKPPTIYIYIYMYMVGGLEHFLFSIIYGIILPIDELIFFKMVKTTKQNSTNNNDSGIDRIVMG